MNEELKNLQRSIQEVKAETSFLKEGVTRLDDKIGNLADDMDAFIAVYVQDYTKLESRVKALEEKQ